MMLKFSPPNVANEVTKIQEIDCISLSDSTSTESFTFSNMSVDNNYGLNLNATELSSILKATELRLGLPEREAHHCQLTTAKLGEKSLYAKLDSNSPTFPRTQKRGFPVAMIEFSERKYTANTEVTTVPLTGNNTDLSLKSFTENIVSAPPKKAQVVSWPPIRSFQTDTLATTTKIINKEEENAKMSAAFYVKVSMDGAPYLRKVNLKAYSAFQELSLDLKTMFSCFTTGQLSENKLECILTYEDKDGDLMLLGDVPWEMFVETCKSLRIMNGPDAIGVAPRATQNCQNKS